MKEMIQEALVKALTQLSKDKNFQELASEHFDSGAFEFSVYSCRYNFYNGHKAKAVGIEFKQGPMVLKFAMPILTPGELGAVILN